MFPRAAAAALFFVLLLTDLARACPAPEAAPARVTALADGLTLVLDTGESVLLAGLYLPLAADTPLGVQAREAVSHLVLGRPVRVRPAAPEPDRYGRLQGQVFLEDDAWVQGALLDAGWAQVATRAGATLCAEDMLEREAAARKAQKGLWGHTRYAVLDGAREDLPIGHFRVVEGMVRRAAVRGSVIYLNFGTDWRRDFTVRAQGPKLARDLAKVGFTIPALENKRVRVRGWIEEWDGPMIKITHAEQLEWVDPVE